MKTWKEYSSNICEYYEWFVKRDETDTKRYEIINHIGEEFYPQKDLFWDYCQSEIVKELKQDKYYLYLIINIDVNDKSKVDHYKKCWKKIDLTNKIKDIKLGKEVYQKTDNYTFYSGIAQTNINHLCEALEIIDMRERLYGLFISKRDYMDLDNQQMPDLCKLVKLDRYHNLDYDNMVREGCRKGDIVCRYGTDNTGAAFALILQRSQESEYLTCSQGMASRTV